MKKFYLFICCLLMLAIGHAQNTYYWVGGAGTVTSPANWGTAANWNTNKGGGGSTRTSVNAGDILIFDGTNIGGGAITNGSVIVGTLPVNETVLGLVLTGNVTVTFATTTRSSSVSASLAQTGVTAGTFKDASSTTNGTYNTSPGAVGAVCYNQFTNAAPVNVGQLITSTTTSYNFNTTSAQGVFTANRLTITGNTATANNGFQVGSGCTLNMSTGNAFVIRLTNATASTTSGLVSGTINVTTAGQRIIPIGSTSSTTNTAPSGALTFANGSAFNITSTIQGNTFDYFANSNNDNVLFQSGSSYNIVPPVQATATATIANGNVTGITFTNRGSGYVTLPTITLSGGDGTLPTTTPFTTLVGGINGNTSVVGGNVNNTLTLVTSAATASGSSVLTFATAATITNAGIYVGQPVSGTNIPGSTTVSAINTSTSPFTITISNAVTSTGVANGATITFSSPRIGSGFTTPPTVTISAPVAQATTGAVLPFPYNGSTAFSCVSFAAGSTFSMNGVGGSNSPLITYTATSMGARTFPNLTLVNSAFPVSGNTTIGITGSSSATLSVDANSSLTMGTNTLSYGGSSGSLTTSGLGTINTSSTNATPIPSGTTWSQLVNYNSASAQTVVTGSYNGGLNLTGGNRTLPSSGTVNVSGTYTAGAGTITTTGSTISFSGTSNIATTPSSFNNLTITGGTLSTAASSTINVAGNVSITGGTFSTGTSSTTNITGNLAISSGATYATGNASTTNVAGNWSNSGTFTAGTNSNVVFNGTNQTITGANTFVNFTKSVTSAATLTLPAGLLQTFSGNLTLNGVSGNLLTINSSSNGSAAQVNYNTGGTNNLIYNSIQDITNSNGTALNSQYSTNVSGNTNITFNNLPKIWIGASSTNWNDANNWSPSGVPISSDNIQITKTGSFDVSLETSPTVASVSVSSGNVLSLNGNTLTVSSTFANSGTVNANTGTLAVTGSFTNDGTFNGNTGTINLSSTFSNTGTYSAGSSIITLSGSFSNGGTYNANSSTLNLSSSFIDNGTFNAGTSSVSFNGTGTVTISTGSSSSSFNNVTIASGKTLTGNLQLGGVLTLGSTTTSIVSGSITFNGTGVQTIPQSTVYNNLTVNNTSGVILGNNITVLGNLNLQAGTLADRGFTLTLRGNILGSGTHTSGGFKMSGITFASGATSIVLPSAPGFVAVNSPIYAAGFDRSTRVTAYDPATRTITFTPATLSAGSNVTLVNVPPAQGNQTALGSYTWTSGNTVTITTPATTVAIIVGNPISAASGIPAGTVVTGYDGATTLTLSQTPTASGTFTAQAVGRITAQNATAASATAVTLGDGSGALTLGNLTLGNSGASAGVTTATLGNTVDVNGQLTFQFNSGTSTTSTANYIDLNEKTLNCHGIISASVINGWIVLGGSNSSTTASLNLYTARVATQGALTLRMDATKKYLNSFVTTGYANFNSTSVLTVASDVIVKDFSLGAATVVVNTGIAATPASITVLNSFTRLFPVSYGQIAAGGSNSIRFSNTSALTLPSTNPFGSGFSLAGSTTSGSTTFTLQVPNLNIQVGQTIGNSSLSTVPIENGTTVAAYDGNLTVTLSKPAIATTTNQTQFFGSPYSTANNSISICDVVINGGGAVNLGCNVGFGGSITLSNNSSLNVGANTLGLYTDVLSIASGSSITANNTSSLVFGGTASNLSIPSNITALNNLTINNTNGVNLNSNLSLAGTLSLLNGNLKNSVSNNITLANATSVNLSGGGFNVAPVFGTTVNLEYRANSQAVATDNAPDPVPYTTGKEIPTSTSVLNNLTFNAYSLSGITITNPGAGYTNAPTITIGNVWAASTAYTVGTQVTNGGNLYTCTQAGTSATANGPLDYGNTLVDGTARWDYVGVAPQAYCKVSGGVVSSIVITMNGSGYTSAPTITISGVSGNNAGVTTTATASAVLTSPTVTLGSNATINGTLNLQNGKLLLSFFNLTTSASAGAITGANANSYILTDTTGKFIRTNVPLNTATTFPMGIVGSYTPLTITNTAGATSTMSVGARRYFNYSLGDSTQALFLQWSVTGTVATTSNITYQFNTNDKGPDFDFTAACELGTYKNSYTVTSVGVPTNVGGGVYTVSATGLSIPTSGNNFYVIANTDNILLARTTWTGDVSTAWTNAANWTNNVPASNLDVVIPVTTVKPVLTSTSTVKNLTIESGALLTITSPGIVQVSRDFTNNGTVVGTGTVSVKGTAAQAIYGTGTVYNLTIDNTSGGVAISSGNQKVGGILTLKSGLLTTNGRLTLKSNAIDSVATVAAVGTGGNTGTISGNVTVERFIPKGKRAFRDLVPGVNTNTSVFANYQESGATGVYGTFITGSALTKTFEQAKSGTNIFNPTTGADYSASGNTSMFSYDNTVATGNWSAGITNTKTSLLTGNKPYRILIRGNRNWSLYLIPQADSMVNSTIIRATGTLYTGNQTISGLNSNINKFSMVGNPYVAPIDWHLVTKNNLNPTMWILSPKTRTYVTVNAATAEIAGATVLGVNTNINRYIQPGQAFFVQTAANGAASLGFAETNKVSVVNTKDVFGAVNENSSLRVGLYKPVSSITTEQVDEVVAVFGASFSNSVNGDDSYKMENPAENLSLINAGNNLAIEARSEPQTGDVLPIGLSKLSNGTNYQIKVNAANYVSNGYDAYLRDAYKQSEVAVKAGNTTVYDFTVDNTVAASYNNRFTIIFKPAVLPLTGIELSGVENNGKVALTLNTKGEQNIVGYEVERSQDGVSYGKVATLAASNKATASYQYTDGKAQSGNNYYRVKVIGNNEAASYSNVVLVKVGGAAGKYVLSPNPAKSGSAISIKLQNAEAGSYEVTVRNVLGQQVHGQVYNHGGGNGVMKLQAPSLAAGSYQVTISGKDSHQVVSTQTLVIE